MTWPIPPTGTLERVAAQNHERADMQADMQNLEVIPYTPDQKQAVIDLAIAAWTPVFAKTRDDVPRFVYDTFYPDGWEARQRADVDTLLETEPQNIWLASLGNQTIGFLGLRIHAEDLIGEIYIIAVSPEHQRKGVGRRLMQFAEDHIKSTGMKMIMVETIGDAGHEPARRAYEDFGFQRWPVARYFKQA
jgi:GNAT superfamily N-acetyltransferase